MLNLCVYLFINFILSNLFKKLIVKSEMSFLMNVHSSSYSLLKCCILKR